MKPWIYVAIPLGMIVLMVIVNVLVYQSRHAQMNPGALTEAIRAEVKQVVQQEHPSFAIQVPPMGSEDGWACLWKSGDDKQQLWLFKYDGSQYIYFFHNSGVNVIKHK